MQIQEFFSNLWTDYTQIAPAAGRLWTALQSRERRILNDHIAFRTYDRAPIALEALEKHILDLGYQRYAPYHFEEKKLRAYGYLHPDPEQPKVFLSELVTEGFSPFLRSTVEALSAQIPAARVETPDVMWAGRLWAPIAFSTYQRLLEESEYAAWVAAIGLRANHFTINVNSLESFQTLAELLDHVEALGYALNLSGGRIKGSPDVLLEQGSTLADRVPVDFADGEIHTIPSCYYEFARRYPDKDGHLYQGFVAASADKIFESTHALSLPRPPAG